MKKILFIICLGFASASGQTYAPVTTSLDQISQAWLASGTYYGTITETNLGQQLDTARTQTKTFWIGGAWLTPSASGVNNDTIVQKGLYGVGQLTVWSNFLRAAAVVTPTLTVTIQASPNGLNSWATVSTYTATASSLTVPTSTATTITKNADWYKILVASSDTASIQLYYQLKKDFIFQKAP